MRALLIKSFTKLSWQSSPRRLAQSLYRFSQVETDSGWQALNLLYNTDDKELQAALFKIAVEEADHAELFYNLAQRIDPRAKAFVGQQERMNLYAKNGSVLETLADISVSESAVHDEFDKYSKATENTELKALFGKIKEDEACHGDDTSDILVRVAGDIGIYRSAMRSASLRRLWRNYSFLSKGLGSFVLSILVSVFYWVFGLLGFLQICFRRILGKDLVRQ